MSLWQPVKLLFIDFFNRLGRIQAPDSDISLTCPLRRLPQTTNTHTINIPIKPYISKNKER